MHYSINTRYGAAFVFALTMAAFAAPRAPAAAPGHPCNAAKTGARGTRDAAARDAACNCACRSGGSSSSAEGARAGRHQYGDRQSRCVLRAGRDDDRVGRADPFEVGVLGRSAPGR